MEAARMHRGKRRAMTGARQRGAVLIMAAGFMLLAAFCLALVVDSGRLYLEKRSLQRVADLAALEAAMRQGCSGPDADGRPGPDARALALENASRNGFAVGGTRRLYAACGELGAGTGAEAGQRVFMVGNAVVADNTLPVNCDQPEGTTLGAAAGNAIRVVVCRTVPASLVVGGLFAGRTVALRAEATALRTEPTAVFRVGSGLIGTNPSAPLMQLLEGVGVDLAGTQVASYNGLANVKITPAGLLKALGVPVGADVDVGKLNEALADAQLSVGDILDAIVELAGQDHLLGVNASLLSALGAKLDVDKLNLNIPLGTETENGPRGLFAHISTASGMGPALDVGVDALQLLTTALELATPDHALKLDVGSPGGALTGLQVQASVIEAPAVGIGGVGTSAYTAQARIYADVDTSRGLLGGVLGLLGARIKLPVIVDGVAAKGTITRIDCDASPRTVTVRVVSSVANACIGRVNAGAHWSDKEVCTESLRDEDLIQVGLLGLRVRNHVALQALPQFDEVTLPAGGFEDTDINQLPVGTLVKNLLAEVLRLLASNEVVENEKLTAAQAGQIAALYATKTSGSYSTSELQAIRDRLGADGFDWTRPALIGLANQTLPNEWYGDVTALIGGCRSGLNYAADCVRNRLTASLQKPKQCGLLGCVVQAVVDLVLGPVIKAVQPLLAVVLEPLVVLLDGVGELLSDLLADTLGLELGRTRVFVDSINCGTARLVI